MSSGVEVPATPPAGAGRGRAIRFGYVPSLDGLRAVAVLGVMLYHGGAAASGGGFLGVNVFFVLSGFLITSLLLGEWRRTAVIRLRRFWARRARRLLPALLVLLVAVTLYARFVAAPGAFATLRWDSLSSLFYFANWHFIAAGSNYFDQTAQPSPLSHLWSLSIEEQFYLVWPPVVLVVLHLSRRLRPTRRLVPLLAVAVAGAAGSALDMALRYDGPGSINRLYEGTDTRAQDLLVGASLAVALAIWAQFRRPLPVPELPSGGHATVWGGTPPHTAPVAAASPAHRASPSPAHRASSGRARVRPPSDGRDARLRGRLARSFLFTRPEPVRAWEVGSPGGRTALQLVGWAVVVANVAVWSHLSGPSPWLFRGGFVVLAVGFAAVIFCSVADQRGLLALVLANPAFRYVGAISYGLYLWHFPLFILLDASRVHLLGAPLLLVRIGVTLVVASVSYFVVEEPIRRRRLGWLSAWRAGLATAGAFAAVAVVTVATTAPAITDAGAGPVLPRAVAPVGPHPVKTLLFGDSVAFTLGFTLFDGHALQAYGVRLVPNGVLGCGVVISQASRGQGGLRVPTEYCRQGAPAADQWPAIWQRQVDHVRPDVVVLVTGRWEVSDQEIDGTWMSMGQPRYDAIVKADLERAVRIGTSTGAVMVLEASPCFDSGEQPDGQPWDEDSPARVREYDSLLHQVAAEHPATVTVGDLGSAMCPGGRYSSTVDGVVIRKSDGVHPAFSPAAGNWYGATILPEVVRVGRLQMEGRAIDGGPLPAPAEAVSRSSAARPG